MFTLWLATTAGAADLHPPRDCLRGPSDGARLARPVVPNGSSITSAVRPIRVWFDPDHANSAEIAPLVVEVLEQAWDVQVDELGFRPPFLPDADDGPEFDVYLFDYSPWAAFVASDGYVDPVAGDGYNTSSSFMVVDRGLPAVAVPSYLSHEFNHACQYATDFSEPTLPIWEGTATAAQEWTVGAEGRWSYDVPSFQEAAFGPVLTGDGYELWPLTGLGYTYEYGTAFWVMFLDQKLGAGLGTNGAALWEAAANEGFVREPDAVDAFVEVAGLPLGDALNAFAVVRFLTGPDWDGRGLDEAVGWGGEFAVPAAPLTGADLPLAAFAAVPPPMVTGQVFVDVDLTGGIAAAAGLGEPWLAVSVSSASGLESAVVVLPWGAAGASTELSAVGPAPVVEVPAGDLVRLVVAITNLGPAGWDGDDPAYVDGDQRLSITVVERATGPVTSTNEPPTTPPPDDELPADPVEGDDAPPEDEGCGCGTAGPPSAGWWIVAICAIRAGSARGRRRGA